MIEGVFECEIFCSRIFFGRKIWQLFFGWLDLSRDFFGHSKQSETRGSACISQPQTQTFNV